MRARGGVVAALHRPGCVCVALTLPTAGDAHHRSDLLTTCGVSSFGTMRDLIKPDPKRLVRNLSAIINFAKYREERVGVYTELTRETVRHAHGRACCHVVQAREVAATDGCAHACAALQDELKEKKMKVLAEREELRAQLEAAR